MTEKKPRTEGADPSQVEPVEPTVETIADLEPATDETRALKGGARATCGGPCGPTQD